jgi:hypothetical protein
MGLDTRAYRRSTDDWKAAWAQTTNVVGHRPAFFGLMVEQLDKEIGPDDAPEFHQDGLDKLDWPGGLVGGMLSGFGDGPSFRGKVYDSYVEVVTGESLYAACEEPWEGEDLAAIAGKLRYAASDPVYDEEPWNWLSREEREALARWFEVCVENELVVGGDY